MAAPSALALSKLIYPETEQSKTSVKDIQLEKGYVGFIFWVPKFNSLQIRHDASDFRQKLTNKFLNTPILSWSKNSEVSDQSHCTLRFIWRETGSLNYDV